MGQLQTEIEPSEVGLDAQRLQRIDRHFAQYVSDGRLPGWLVLVARHGKIAHLATHGMRDVEAGLPVESDTLFRIYSMTKPITSVAAMMLYEQGVFELTDPISRFLPAFTDQRVYVNGSADRPQTRPATEPIRIWHLLTHTAGLTYGFHHIHPVDRMYRDAGFEWGHPSELDLAGACDAWAEFPLLFDPGQSWNYSVATDVLGRLVEVASGQALEAFFREHILDPLDMRDTGFSACEQDGDRLAALYTADRAGKAVRNDRFGRVAHHQPRVFSGGGGLISSARDYHRFTLMLLGGGQLEGARLLSNRTVDYMTRNHLPGGADLETLAMGTFSETANAGKGFGLGFSVNEDPTASKVVSSVGQYAWGGAASTSFWVDPREELTVVFLTQLLPSSTHPIRSQLQQLVYQALVD
ncbi:CubicO group peptidase (beta-lactamase class C family) [Halopolyspora algeriensis]|uniref:CubicO group peptidase (Beta-lactamase class C family) n=1 Tax=Halopolyspora algeriensis TaxID=1500506 RepID=A0A368VQ12_9ACTN|nr:serine hydrolase domain-containing protein [Halopolyspora algeriensis]RCW43951.1 CubicO group peptidase (beta-lactamase class C family) [Halopolyspora algeriensis]TQM53546.1 CubicO group peptidase (beta-lactamase class C family) [Halopolyspora algeriensis]